MSRFIKQTFIILVMVLLYVGGSLPFARVITYVSMKIQQSMVEPMLIDLNMHGLHYYPFSISKNRCDSSSNTI